MTFIEDLMRKELRLNGCFMSYSAPFPGHEWTRSVSALADGQAGHGHDDLAPLSVDAGGAGL